MQDWYPALEAHKEIYEQSKANPDVVRAWLYDRLTKYGPGATLPSAMAFEHELEDLMAADTLTLSHEMMDLAQHALQSFDRTEPCTPDEFLVESGFLYLPEPFTTLDNSDKKVCWRAVMFRLVPDVPWRESAEEEEHYGWGVRFTLYSHRLDMDDYPMPDWMQKRAAEIGWDWGYAHATTVPIQLFNRPEHMGNEGDPSADWVNFVRVILRLMQETIVVRAQHTPPRAQRRAAARTFKEEPNRLVNIIELRRPSVRELPDDNGEGMDYSHRFIVRGHWRKGHWRKVHTNAGLQDRFIKQSWVGAYEKGDGNLPLIIKDRVWVWDR
jgi:hypothetical protein